MTTVDYEYSLQLCPHRLSSSQSTNSINFSFILISRCGIETYPESGRDRYIYLPEQRFSEIEINVQVNRGSLNSDDIANINQLLHRNGIPTDTSKDIVKEICDTTESDRCCSIHVVVKKVMTGFHNLDDCPSVNADDYIDVNSSRAESVPATEAAVDSLEKVKLDGGSVPKFEECRISRQDFGWM